MKKIISKKTLLLLSLLLFLPVFSGCFLTPSVNQAPTITSTPSTTATVAEVYAYNVNATDPDEDTLTYTLTTSPTGMIIVSTTGVISWTPTSTQSGDHSVTVEVSDGSLSAIQSFIVIVSKAAIIHPPTHPTSPDTAVAFSTLTANGTSTTVTTTELTLTLDQDVNLVIGDLTVTGATLDTVTDNNDGTYILAVSSVTVADGADVTVAVAKAGFAFTPTSKTVAVYVDTTVPTITSVTSGAYSKTTGVLTLTVVGAGAVGDVVDVTKIQFSNSGSTMGPYRFYDYGLTNSTGVVTNASTITVTLSVVDIRIVNGATGTVTVNVSNGVLKDTAGNVSADFGTPQTGKSVSVTS